MLKEIRSAPRGVFSLLKTKYLRSSTHAGKVTLVTLLSVTTFTALIFGAFFKVQVPHVSADDVSTSVTVLNTPPVWDSPAGDAHEETESSTTTPTNAGQALRFKGTATDSNNDPYYLLICKTSGTPTANSGAAPTCNGGVANQWTVSTSTVSGTEATAATTTKETFPFDQEKNDWYGWVCDGNTSLAQCNLTFKQGNNNSNLSSPFVINHPPVFSAIINSSPTIPGGSITWTATASDSDTIRGGDTVKLSVCRVADYATTTSSCGAGGAWAASTLAASNPATTTQIGIPFQDTNYNAFVYVSDNSNSAATSTFQGFNSTFTVNNVAPTISAASVTLVDTRTSSTTGFLTLFVPNATSGPYQVEFQVADNNSCVNASSTNEISVATTSIYRSGFTQSACQTSGNYDTNACYPSINPQTVITCSQDTTVGNCSGNGDTTVTWTCTFQLWYNADPTDGSTSSDTQFFNQNWLASVQVTDDDTLLSPLVESTTGNDVASFLAFNVTQTTIGYGGLQPGQENDPLATTTNLLAIGNIGLDEDLYGGTMCTDFSSLGGPGNPDACDTNGIDSTRDIPVDNQKFATTSIAFGSAFAFALTSSTSPSSLLLNVKKTTSTSTPETKDTFWGIHIPLAITQAGAYKGQNTLTAKKSDPAFWQ